MMDNERYVAWDEKAAGPKALMWNGQSYDMC